MDWLITLLIAVPAIILAFTRSSWLVDYSVFVFVFNRGLRRVVDYYINGAFNPLSPISLTPLVVAGVMALVLAIDFQQLRPTPRKFFLFFFLAFGLSLAIGMLNVQLAAIYALAEVLAPVGLAGYVILLNPSDDVKDRWFRSFSWGAILVSAYGWYQYLTIPPWDAFWLVSVDMVGYMGYPEPTQMTVFSTMAERGPVAAYLGYAVVPMIVSPRWRTIAGWPGVILVFSVILLSMCRSGLIIAAVSTVVFLLLNRGAKSGQIALACVILAAASIYGIEKIPNSQRVTERFESLKNMRQDGSYLGRTKIMSDSIGSVLSYPLGLGLGAGGTATRVNTGTVGNESQFGDGGYFDILLTYGILGTLLMLAALGVAWKNFAFRFRLQFLRDDYVLLARALMASLLVTCFVGNLLNGFSVLWLAFGCAFAIPARQMEALRHALKIRQQKAQAAAAAEHALAS